MINEELVVMKQKENILISLDNQDFDLLRENLKSKINNISEGMVGAEVVLDVGKRKLTKKESGELMDLLLEKGLHLKRLISRGKSMDLGRGATRNDRSPPESIEKLEIPITDETILIKRTLRSGQRVFYPGNIVILGDVNPGAEVIAGGNIVVMGTMRGLVHAGALGAEQAVIAAFRLNPTQLRIANHFTRPPEGGGLAGCEPEIACIRNGKVVIEKFKV